MKQIKMLFVNDIPLLIHTYTHTHEYIYISIRISILEVLQMLIMQSVVECFLSYDNPTEIN